MKPLPFQKLTTGHRLKEPSMQHLWTYQRIRDDNTNFFIKETSTYNTMTPSYIFIFHQSTSWLPITSTSSIYLTLICMNLLAIGIYVLVVDVD